MKFRGMTEQGELVTGYLFVSWDQYFILWGTTNDIPDMTKIIPESLAMSTTQIDKNKKEIFGSIELEDGTMSKGGDRLEMIYIDYSKETGCIKYSKDKARFRFYSDKKEGGIFSFDNTTLCEVIGNQFEHFEGKEK